MYIDNQDFLKQLSDHDESALLESFSKISTGCSQHRYFRDYKFMRDDLRQEMMIALWNSRFKFDPKISSNPFSYFTTIAIRAGLSLIAKENIQRDILNTLEQEILNTLEQGEKN